MTIVKSLLSFLALSLMVFAPWSAKAQMPAAGVPSFMPTASWKVEPTFLSKDRKLSNIKLPCMMANSYNNGYVLRLSGGGGTILAMAVDFKQNVFHQGRKYDATLQLNNGYSHQVKATAFSEGVLIFNVRAFNGFYQGLLGAQGMIVDVEGNAFQFGLGNLAEAMQRLEACFGGAMPPPIVPVGPQPVSAPVGPVGSVSPPLAPGGETGGDPIVGPRVSKAMGWNSDLSSMPPSLPPRLSRSSSQMLWEAKAGDDLRMTLERWAGKAGVAVDWQSAHGGQVVDDVRVSGSFEDAVQTLMAQNAAALGIEANMRGSTSHTGRPQQLIPTTMGGVSPPPPPGAVNSQARWFAPAGSNLQQVLRTWSKQAGVEFEWQSNQGFAVKRAVSANGSYEDALYSLLNQFSGDRVRPAAQLNNDPVTGRRVLFAQSTRVL